MLPITMTEPEAWRQAVVAWYAGGPVPEVYDYQQARRVGLPGRPQELKPKDRVRVLFLAGFDDEDLVAAVPELDTDLVLRVAWGDTRRDGTIEKVFSRHLEGLTPLEISRDTGITRPKVYYWLTRFNLTPHRHVRTETNARQRASIVSAYNRGDRLVDIATRLNVSYDQVRYAVKVAK